METCQRNVIKDHSPVRLHYEKQANQKFAESRNKSNINIFSFHLSSVHPRDMPATIAIMDYSVHLNLFAKQEQGQTVLRRPVQRHEEG
jgi:hypothetical protein